jgi:hypothetical protein
VSIEVFLGCNYKFHNNDKQKYSYNNKNISNNSTGSGGENG